MTAACRELAGLRGSQAAGSCSWGCCWTRRRPVVFAPVGHLRVLQRPAGLPLAQPGSAPAS